MINNILVLVSTKSNPLHANVAWKDEAFNVYLCPYCRNVKRSFYPNPIDVVVEDRPSGIYDPVSFTGLKLFHINFIMQIKDKLKDFVLGECYDTSGNRIPEYVTCYSDKYVIIRGTDKSRYKICPECGTVSPMGWYAPPYIWRKYLSEEQVYQTSSCVMLLDEELALNLDFSPWKGLMEFDLIPVRDEPIDGQHLPIDGSKK
jgi:hypothetical protein